MKLDHDQLLTIIDNPDFSPFDLIKTFHNPNKDEPFYIMDVGDLLKKHENWLLKLPNVKPFYAVKCNDSPVVLKVLASLGVCFDCASKGEINKILELEGVGPERIIFANPAKPVTHIKYAARVGVDLLTFDNSLELQKIKAYHPKAKLVLRVRCDATSAQCQLGSKFGCDPDCAAELLETAAALNLAVVGVSFHVGSGCQELSAYQRALRIARSVVDIAAGLNMCLNLIDIGGGFPGDSDSSIDKVAGIINESISEEFGDLEGMEFIAEPGRYFAASAYTLAATIHSKRQVKGKPVMYYINDGVYGSFNCILYDHAVPVPVPFEKRSDGEVELSSVWGPTCDALDVVCPSIWLPSLSEGDLLVFSDMGAYTLPIASTFNGYPKPIVHHVVSQKNWEFLKEILGGGSGGLTILPELSLQPCKQPATRDIYSLLAEIVN